MSHPLRALIVEDSQRDAELLLLELRRGGYEVSHQCVQTAEAMRRALSRDWDVVISDYTMPSFSALAALSLLKSSGRDIPFIIVSGTIGEETAVEALKAGAHDFLVKHRLSRLLPALARELREAQVRRERRQATAVLDRLYEVAPIGLALLDRELRFVRLNEALAAIDGLPPGAHVGRPIRDVSPQLGASLERFIDRIVETGRPVLDLEVSGETKARPGEQRHWLVNYYPVYDDRGGVLGVGATVVDITERKGDEAERERLLAELNQAVRARDEFLSIASHELKTPLTPLELQLGSALELVRAKRPTPADPLLERLERKLGIAMRQTERLASLVNKLLDVTRITSERLTLSRSAVELRGLVTSLIERLAEAIRASGAEVRVVAEAPVVGSWDPVALESVVSNLLGNALKYGEGKPIEVTVGAEEGFARLAVTDHGIGIAPEEQERIFQRFERAVAPKHYGGFGIGLWVARQVVEAHGGTIHVASAKGAGSTFTVELPIVPDGALDPAHGRG